MSSRTYSAIGLLVNVTETERPDPPLRVLPSHLSLQESGLPPGHGSGRLCRGCRWNAYLSRSQGESAPRRARVVLVGSRSGDAQGALHLHQGLLRAVEGLRRVRRGTAAGGPVVWWGLKKPRLLLL